MNMINYLLWNIHIKTRHRDLMLTCDTLIFNLTGAVNFDFFSIVSHFEFGIVCFN